MFDNEAKGSLRHRFENSVFRWLGDWATSVKDRCEVMERPLVALAATGLLTALTERTHGAHDRTSPAKAGPKSEGEESIRLGVSAGVSFVTSSFAVKGGELRKEELVPGNP